MATDSRWAGYLTPSGEERSNPTTAVRMWVAGITGLPLTEVRRTGAAHPAKTPPIGANWCAVSLQSMRREGSAYVDSRREPDDVTVTRWQSLKFSLSFYGDDALLMAERFLLGARVEQHLTELSRFGLKLRRIDEDVMHVPDLYNSKRWVDRYVVGIELARSIGAQFGVRTIKTAGIKIITEKGVLNE